MKTTSPALRFIKQNVPEIEIMEFPLWREYVRKLKEGWDVVGFSFLEHDIGEVLEMAAQARRQGIKEIWAEGYGALDPVTAEFADRVFYGYSEELLLEEVFGRKLERLRHPPIVWSIDLYLPPSVAYKKLGVLFTQRGCPYRCVFCQTPVHSPRPSRIPLESIDEVLRYYKSCGINELFILDETFYTFPSHSEQVLDMLARYGFHWWVQSRVELILKHLDDWVPRGMSLAAIGVESVSNEILSKIGKRTSVELMREFKRQSIEKQIFVVANYMLGYEEDTRNSILRDIEFIQKNCWFDAFQLTVLTPFPRTPIWYEFKERYGIFEKDYHKYDARSLVWNHPNITPAGMQYLKRVAMASLNVPMRDYGKGILRMAQKRTNQKGLGFLWDDLVRPVIHCMSYNERNQVFLR